VNGDDPAPAPPRPLWRRLLPLLAIAAGMALVFATGLHRYLSLEALRQHRDWLQDAVALRPLAAAAAYLGIYIVAVALSIPGALFLTLAGGFLFGIWLGTALTVAGATLGATALFLAARTAVGGLLRARAGSFVARMEAGFRANAFSYLLVLRLVPVFPFFVVNLVPAFLGVPLGVFVAATLLGIVPGTLVYASVGNGLGAVLAAGGAPDLGLVLQPEVLGPLLGLAALSLLPVAVKRLRRGPAAGD